MPFQATAETVKHCNECEVVLLQVGVRSLRALVP